MKYYVIINGNSSLNIQGLAIESLPNISKPLIRTTREEIDGRDGDIITKLGYSAYDKTLNIGLWGNYDINEVIAFFNQEGVITFSNEPDKYYKFTIVNRIDFVNELEKFKKASITIHCQPFKYQEQPEVVAEEEAVELTGTSFKITDSLEAPLLMDLKGNTIQNGTPTPSSPIPVNVVSGDNDINVFGVNLYHNTTMETEFHANFTDFSYNVIDDNSLSITASSTSTSQKSCAVIMAIDTTKLKPNTQYTLSCNNSVSGTTFTNAGALRAKVGDTYGTTSTNNSVSFTTPTTITTIGIAFYLAYNTQMTGTSTITFSNIMMNEGATALPYEPYTGTTYNIELPVENLIDYYNMKATGGYGNEGYLPSNTNYTTIQYIKVQPNTKYTLTTNIDITKYSGLRVSDLNSSKTFIRRNATIDITSQTQTFTTSSDAVYIALSFWTSGTASMSDITQAQLEQGSKANSYTPYGTTPIELNKIGTYQDYIYKQNDKWYLHKEIGKVVLDGTESWSKLDNSSYSSTILRFRTTDITDVYKESDNTISILSNYFEGKLLSVRNTNSIARQLTDSSGINIFIDKNNLSGEQTSNFKTWLSTHNTITYYVLETPTNTEITYQPLINQLNALEDAESYEGTTNINQVNNDLPFIIDLTYFTGDNTITITNDGNICSKPLLRIKGTSDISISLNGIQIFQITLQNNETIIIDTEKMEAYYDGILKNRQVIGDYNNFKLNPGENTIEINGDFDYVRISRYSRWV